jgi:hypothetical protein
MTEEEIETIYPLFKQWVKSEFKHQTIDGIGQIKLWHQYLDLRAAVAKKWKKKATNSKS